MLISEIIRKKRSGETLGQDELDAMMQGVTTGSASDAQVAAFAMAVFFQGMTAHEAAALTLAVRDSGEVLDWSHLDGPTTDKHSTGGVGDNVSLILAPVVAACGAYVPMISGRGLGHTGGTLDKMDAIPGYVSQPSSELFRQTVEQAGCAIIGQTADLAPADKRLYAIRDVTATVESVPLITASILSKKLAAGLGSLVLDVKLGNGAFMTEQSEALALAEALTNTADAAGLPCRALLTDMNQPLAPSAGNAVEVHTALDVLTGNGHAPRLRSVVIELAAEMLVAAGLTATVDEGRAKSEHALASGAAAEVFGRMVAQLGGPSDFIENAETYLPSANVVRDVKAPTNGIVAGYKTRDLGLAVIALGGGRKVASDSIDHSVGISDIAPIGTSVTPGETLARVHARTAEDADRAEDEFLDAIHFAQGTVAEPALIHERI